MNDSFDKRLGAAIRAAWCTVVIWAVFLMASWGVYMLAIHTRPSWLLVLWGGYQLNWSTVQLVFLYFIAAAKLLLFAFVLVTICLTLWRRQLRRIS